MEEFELSEQCRLGNNRARKELYEHYGGRLLGVCLRYTGDRSGSASRWFYKDIQFFRQVHLAG